MAFASFYGGFLNDIPNIRNKCLLNLRMQMNFWFFNKYDLAKWTFFFSVYPLQMKMTDLYRHINKVFESQPIIGLRKLMV